MAAKPHLDQTTGLKTQNVSCCSQGGEEFDISQFSKAKSTNSNVYGALGRNKILLIHFSFIYCKEWC